MGSGSGETGSQDAHDTELVGARLHHPSLEERIYANLKPLLLKRRLPPGDKIPVDQLARELGVSRTPVLNALRRLAQEGIVEVLPRRGIFVRHFSKRQLAELYEVREVLEGLAARLAAARLTEAEVDRLQAAYVEVDAVSTPEALRAYVEVDRQFHWRLVELSGSQQLARTVESVSLLIFSYQEGLARTVSESIREHRQILEALRRRDAEDAERLMRRHHHLSVERFRRDAEAETAAERSEDLPGEAAPRRGPGSDGAARHADPPPDASHVNSPAEGGPS